MPSFLHRIARKDLLQLRKKLDKGQTKAIVEQLSPMKVADAAELLGYLSSSKCVRVLDMLPVGFAAQVIASFDERMLRLQLKELSPEQLMSYVSHLDSDDAADLLMMFPSALRERVLEQLPDEKKTHHLEELLLYEKDIAGGLMAKELMTCRPEDLIEDCCQLLREQLKVSEQNFFMLYVVDEGERLLGTLSLVALLTADHLACVSSLYRRDPVSVTPYVHKREITWMMRKYDLEALPVVSFKGRLLGRITVDDVMDAQEELAEEEQTLMGGLSEYNERHERPWQMLGARLPWLLVGLFGGLVSAYLMSFFETQIVLIPALLFFVPLLTSMAGNVSIQSALGMIQTFSYRKSGGSWLWNLLWRIWWVALLSALLLGFLVMASVWFAFGDVLLGVAVGVALGAIVLAAAVVGSVAPLFLLRMGFNPILATGPFLTTLNDVMGISIYLVLVYYVYGWV